MIHRDDDESWLLKDIADNVESADRFSCCSLKCSLRCPEIPASVCFLGPLAIVRKILPAFGVFDEDAHGRRIQQILLIYKHTKPADLIPQLTNLTLRQGRGCSCNLDRSRAWSQNHFPRYLDGLRIRSSLSASSLSRTVCRRLCWTAFTRDWGSNQACLTRWIIVRQTIFRARIGWYLRAPCRIIRLNFGFRTEFKQNRSPSPELR